MTADLMSTLQVAKAAGVTVPTVTRWVADGKLVPAHKADGLRGAYVFERTEVERWLTARANEFLS